MTLEKDCDQCKHMRQPGGRERYCMFGPFSRLVTYMRHPRSMCGENGNLWEKADGTQHEMR